MVDVIIPTNLVCVVFGPGIPISILFNRVFFVLVTVLFFIALWAKSAIYIFQQYHLAWFAHSILNLIING
jgi:hypothetical protein